MRYAALLGLIGLIAASCSAGPSPQATPATTPETLPSPVPSTAQAPPLSPAPVVRLALVGDVMLGRGVAAAAASPDELWHGVRHLLTGVDVAAANLESPLTTRSHVAPGANVLLADPAAADALARAGFDLVAVTNNHTFDAGPSGLADTLAAVTGAGLVAAGAGATPVEAARPAVLAVSDTTVGFLAFDATGTLPDPTAGPTAVAWDDIAGPQAVAALRAVVDIVVVSVHGGTEYLPVTDPRMSEIAAAAHAAGADVVWGHGAHVVQPVSWLPGPRPAVVATSLGNFLFDQSGPGRTTGALLEVMADPAGVIAFRVAMTDHRDGRVRFDGWLEPSQDAAWIDGAWWTLVRRPPLAPQDDRPPADFRHGDLVAVGRGDVTGSGSDHVVASFRRPYQPTAFNELRPDVQWADAAGRSAHLGVYRPEGLEEVWVAGTVLEPIARLAVCTGSVAVAHDTLDDPAVTGAGAWVWNGFGFDTAPPVPGPGVPACGDVDGDGRLDPLAVERSAR